MKHESIVVVYDSCQAIGDYLYADSPKCNLNNWICAISPTYKTIITMQYIFIVALEFVLAFIGVALLIRYYNHKA